MRLEGVHDDRNVLSKFMERKSVEDWEGLHHSSAYQAAKGDQKETLSEAGIPMLRENTACPHIKYKRIHQVYKYKWLENT